MVRYTETESMVEHSYAQQLNDPSSNDGEQSSPVTASTATQTMELREHTPVVYMSSTVITRQPGENDNQSPRRPTAINTSDWISTPRAQINATSGTQFLADVEQLEIAQVIDYSTLIGRIDRGIQYRVKVPRAETLFLAMESKPETESRCFGWYKGFVLNVLNPIGETAFVIRKDPSWKHVLGSRQKITMESANTIGSVEENFSLIGPSFTVYDEFKTPFCHINGPNICGCCMSCKSSCCKESEYSFQVTSIDGTHQIASLIYQWDHFSVDYVLLLTFPMDTDVKLKSLLIGASFLIEYLYFQRAVVPTVRTLYE